MTACSYIQLFPYFRIIQLTFRFCCMNEDKLWTLSTSLLAVFHGSSLQTLTVSDRWEILGAFKGVKFRPMMYTVSVKKRDVTVKKRNFIVSFGNLGPTESLSDSKNFRFRNVLVAILKRTYNDHFKCLLISLLIKLIIYASFILVQC
jgi:hypothetical protein